jgi:adenylate cyclase
MGNYIRKRIADKISEMLFEEGIENEEFGEEQGKFVDLEDYMQMYAAEIEEGRNRKRNRLLREARQRDDEYKKEEIRKFKENERKAKTKLKSDSILARNARSRLDRLKIEEEEKRIDELSMVDFQGASPPNNESLRLQALESFHIPYQNGGGENLNNYACDKLTGRSTIHYSIVADLVDLACSLFQVPSAVVSLVGKHRVIYKACKGFVEGTSERNLTMCSYALKEDKTLVIPDTMKDERYCNHPIVKVKDPLTKKPVRFYAGTPLRTSDGYNLGIFSVMDLAPRDDFDEAKVKQLQTFADLVVRDMEVIRDLWIAENSSKLNQCLVEFTQQLKPNLTLDEIFDQAVLTIVDNMEVDYCELYHREEGKWKLISSFGWSEINEHSEAIVDYVMSLNEPLAINDMEEGYNFTLPNYYTKQRVQSMLCAPIKNEAGVHGMIGVFKNTKHKWENHEKDYVVSFTQTVARCIDMDLWQREITSERRKSEDLLQNILPHPIAVRLKQKKEIIAERISSATVAFADIVGFTALSGRESPENIVNFLNIIFSEFDRLTQKYDLEKIKTIGDSYMFSGGLLSHEDDHASVVIEMALDMIDYIHSKEVQELYNINIRVGIGTGTVVAGVIGQSKYSYDLWGDAVNVASRMESLGIPGKIQIATSTLYSIQYQDNSSFNIEERGFIDVKGKGKMKTFIVSRKPPVTNA